MGIEDFIEDAAGALAAEQGLSKLDPNANMLEKGAALVAGYEGTDFLKGKLGEMLGGGEHAQAPAQDDAQAPAAQDDGSNSWQDDSQNT